MTALQIDRAVVEQALEALEHRGNIYHMECPAQAAIVALRAALAQQAEPVCRCDFRTRMVGDGCAVCNPELAKELAQQEQAEDALDRMAENAKELGLDYTPLAPQPAKACAKESDCTWMPWCKTRGKCQRLEQAEPVAEVRRLRDQNKVLLEALRDLEKEFRRTYPIYYCAEPWGHETNRPLQVARAAIKAAEEGA